MKNSETHIKTVLGDTIVALCRNMLSQYAHVHVEGLLGITLNSDEIFLVNISRSISNSLEGVKTKLESSNGGEMVIANSSDHDNGEEETPKDRQKGRKRKNTDDINGNNMNANENTSEDFKLITEAQENYSEESDNSGAEDELSDDCDRKEVDFSNLSDTRAMFGSYSNTKYDVTNNKHNQTDNETNVSDPVTIKTELLSDDDSESNSASAGNSDQEATVAQNLSWPFAFPQGFVTPSMRLPTVHLPNITNMILGESNSNNGAGRSVNPEWFGSRNKTKTLQCSNDNTIGPTLLSPSKNGRGVRRWTKRQRGPETIVDLMLAEQNMMNSKTCPLCGRSFGEAWIMRRHMMVHTGAKAYQCNLCQKKFTRKDVLSAHMKVHYPKKGLEICNGSSSLCTDDQADFGSISSSNFPWNGSMSSLQHSTTGTTGAITSDAVSTTAVSTAIQSPSYSSDNNSTPQLSALSKSMSETSNVNITASSEAAMNYAASNHLLLPAVSQSLMHGTQLGNVQLG